ncbi:GtrA family protein [Aidingimonas lacisalsi]|uniref:GtrA family protein n=1 Tax=Aidingimonas lacisalsi TaxID=2604086 RepID=UPI0013762BDB|nr:GtrA family protein [Aidingimonas lacisalsi]
MLRRFLHSTSQRATFLRFALVGGTIALIDAGSLYGLHDGFDLNLYLSRVFSYGLAITAGYFLNRHFTFHYHQRFRSILSELMRFYAVHATGGMINYGLFALVLLAGGAIGLTPGAVYWLPLLGIWLGGVAGMCFNFFVSHKLVFHRP